MVTDDSVDVPLALEPSGSKLAVESCLVKLYLFGARGLGPSADDRRQRPKAEGRRLMTNGRGPRADGQGPRAEGRGPRGRGPSVR